jgi:adenosylhomocysteine nucleosidase
MEGAAIGHVSHINDIPFVVIRCISDNADEEATMNYETFEKIAANQSSNIVLNMINMINMI